MYLLTHIIADLGVEACWGYPDKVPERGGVRFRFVLACPHAPAPVCDVLNGVVLKMGRPAGYAKCLQPRLLACYLVFKAIEAAFGTCFECLALPW